MIGLDVHVLTLPGLPEAWIAQRRASIAAAIDAAGFPVVVHEVEGIPDHLGRSRRLGYSFGDHPYATHVDHDDYVTPDAFKVLLPALAAGAEAITTGETVLRGNGDMTHMREARHHLAVFRRDVLQAVRFERLRHFPDQLLLRSCDPEHIAECVYVHRIHPDSASRRERRADPNGARDEQRVVNDPSLLAVELMTPIQIADEIEEWIGG